MIAEQITQLKDDDLSQIVKLAEAELRKRTERRRQEVITKIRELASTAGVTVTISGSRGRPAKVKSPGKSVPIEKEADL